MVSEECPFCHKFLAPELLSREEVATDDLLREKDVLLKTGLTVETGERVADHPEAFVTHKFGYRCKSCGKEWSTFRVREVEVSKEYVEDEEEKTDYDADKESEDTTGEEYGKEEE